jgi:hypothetical protein
VAVFNTCQSTCDISRWTPYQSFADRDIKRNRKQGNKNAEISICDMAIQSQPLNQSWIWTVDVTPYRSFGDRDLGRQRTQCIKNVDFVICEIAIQSQPLNRDQIWTVDHTPYRSFVDRDLEVTRTFTTGMSKSRYAKSRNDLSHQTKR